MRKIQISTLKILYSGDKILEDIYLELHKLFPSMVTGINLFNIAIMLNKLWDNDYIYKDQSIIPFKYSLTAKGKIYILSLKQGGINNV